MLITLILIVTAGLGCAGVALMARKLTGNTLPKWLIPASAGLGMLTVQIVLQYSWFDQQLLRLPAAAVVVSQESSPSPWRPWTYALPLTSAYTLLDTQQINKRQMDGETIAEFMLYRIENSITELVSYQHYLLNCSIGELVPVSKQGEPQFNEMRKLTEQDDLYIKVCL